jgi:hypothetical protein
MMKICKSLTLVASAATLLGFGGCLSAFWDGFWRTGWPSDNRWLNLGIDVANEVLFG